MLSKYSLDQFILEISTANVRIEITPMNEKVLTFNDSSSLEMFKEEQSEKLSLACWAFVAKMKVEHPDNYFSVISRELENIQEKQKQLFIPSPNGGVYRKKTNISYEGKPGVRLDELEDHFRHDVNSYVNVQNDNLTMARSVLKVSMDNHKGLKPLFKGECIRCTNQNPTPPASEKEEDAEFLWKHDDTYIIRLMHVFRLLGWVEITGDDPTDQKFFDTVKKKFGINDIRMNYTSILSKSSSLQNPEKYFHKIPDTFMAFINGLLSKDGKQKGKKDDKNPNTPKK